MLDLRLVNATFVTMDHRHPIGRELGAWRGRIVALDAASAALPLRPGGRTLDLGGATVLPGFVDGHVHLAWAGLSAVTPSVAPCTSVPDVLDTVRSAAARRGEGEWVDIVGYDQRWLGRHLTAAELDTVSAGRKVFVVHDSGHACVVNSAVLPLLPDGVVHENGVLAEGGMAAVRALRQPYPVEELAGAIDAAGRACLAEGITSCAEAGIGGGLIMHSTVELAAYQRALETGRLPVRVQLMVVGDALRPAGAHPSDGIPRALDLGLRTGFGGDRLSIGALKVFADGGMMARTAALTSPYVGLDHCGQYFAEPDALVETVVDGHRAGWQLAVHAIGDRAVDLALSALARAQEVAPRPDARHRIEHAGLVRPDQLERFASLNVTAVVQPNFLWSFGDDYAAIMGPEREGWLYRGRAFLDHGVRLVGSSDRPVTIGAPLRAIQFMVERRSKTGSVVGPDEAITVEQALRAYTIDAAHACHREADLGSITPGKLADLTVLSADPRHVDPSHIAGIEVLATLVGGEVVHSTTSSS